MCNSFKKDRNTVYENANKLSNMIHVKSNVISINQLT